MTAIVNAAGLQRKERRIRFEGRPGWRPSLRGAVRQLLLPGGIFRSGLHQATAVGADPQSVSPSRARAAGELYDLSATLKSSHHRSGQPVRATLLPTKVEGEHHLSLS